MSGSITTQASIPTSGLASVSLDELNELAELQTRTDRKYIVSTNALSELIDSFGDQLAVLEIEGQTAFGYESVYFDTPTLDFYRDAAHRRRRRFKVRTRTYLDSGLTMLEVKSKGCRKATVKSRTAHTSRRHLDAAAEHFVDDQLGADGVAQTLRPVLTTTYQRTTLLSRTDRSRITIDLGLRCVDEHGGCVQLPDSVIVETKTGGAPCAVDRWLWAAGLRPQKVSKFGTALAALHPELPSNKWHRVIAQHFNTHERSLAGRCD